MTIVIGVLATCAILVIAAIISVFLAMKIAGSYMDDSFRWGGRDD